MQTKPISHSTHMQSQSGEPNSGATYTFAKWSLQPQVLVIHYVALSWKFVIKNDL